MGGNNVKITPFAPVPGVRCPKCGYDCRVASSGDCPECGQSLAPDAIHFLTRRRYRRKVIRWGVVIFLLAVAAVFGGICIIRYDEMITGFPVSFAKLLLGFLVAPPFLIAWYFPVTIPLLVISAFCIYRGLRKYDNMTVAMIGFVLFAIVWLGSIVFFIITDPFAD